MTDPKPVTVRLAPSSEDMRPDDYVFLQGDHAGRGAGSERWVALGKLLAAFNANLRRLYSDSE